MHCLHAGTTSVPAAVAVSPISHLNLFSLPYRICRSCLLWSHSRIGESAGCVGPRATLGAKDSKIDVEIGQEGAKTAS